MTPARFVAIHGHFYQPPRENPWLERVEVQDSAAPHHDWNARVAAECYAPNSAARRVDPQNRIVDVVNNFAQVAFDVGPTLMAWLERERPDVHAAIVEADRASRAARGHGNAIAQAYGHAILPLCSRRDKVTQVRWGLADFRHRFGREAEGLWLPETAVDRETLEVLADEGLRFTILAPGQAAAAREAAGEWRMAAATGIDGRRAYRCVPAPGREIALFFYDGPTSHAIAFGGLLDSGDAFAARVLGGFGEEPRPQLVHVATDGESYGHHHRFGEMALAAACAGIEAGGATLTNHAAFLAAHPPTAEARVVEGSSWSCDHGVERWRADCGCRAGRSPGWSQAWRAPLREALDWLRDTVDPLYEARAGALLKDPWAARDDYVRVLLDRSLASVDAFVERHQLRPLALAERVQLLKCLELQRHRLLMYTSCGWFFDEISGLETVQVLRYAARAVELARELGGDAALEASLVRRLAAAPSNVPELANGAGVWRRHVVPARADLRRIIAQYAIAAPYEDQGDPAELDAFWLQRLGWARETRGETSLTLGRVRATSRVTTESEEAELAVLHFGGADFHCVLRAGTSEGDFAATRAALLAEFGAHGLAEVVRALDRHFDGRAWGVRDLFLEERRRLLAHVAERALAQLEATYERSYEDNRRLMQYLEEVNVPAPAALAVAARHVLERAVRRELAALASGAPVAPGAGRLRALIQEARGVGLALELRPPEASAPLEAALARAVGRLAGDPTPASAADALELLAVSGELGAGPDLWASQNQVFRLWRAAAPETRAVLAPLLAALGFAPPPALEGAVGGPGR